MAEKQTTLAEFIETMEKWAEETINGEARLFIRDWKGWATEDQWKIIGPLPLEAKMVTDFAKPAAAHLWLLRIGTILNPFYKQRLKETHAFLRAIYEKATELGIEVDIRKIDLPLLPSVPIKWAQKKEDTIADLLLTEHTGKLRVIIKGVGEFTPDFDPKIIGYTPTIFDYIGHAYACLVTNLTTKLSVETRPFEWRIIKFSAGKRIIKVEKIGDTGKCIIRIVSVPKGPDIPEEIRKGWIGTVFEAEGPTETVIGSALKRVGGPIFGVGLVYWVPSHIALKALKYHNRKSWEWFRSQRKLSPDFTFNTECCEVVKQ